MKKLIILLLLLFVAVYILDSEGMYSMERFLDLIKDFWNSFREIMNTDGTTETTTTQ